MAASESGGGGGLGFLDNRMGPAPLWVWLAGVLVLAYMWSKYTAAKTAAAAAASAQNQQTQAQQAQGSLAASEAAQLPPEFVINEAPTIANAVASNGTRRPRTHKPTTTDTNPPPTNNTPPPANNNPPATTPARPKYTTYTVNAWDAANPTTGLVIIAQRVGHPGSYMDIYDANAAQLNAYAASIGQVESQNVERTHWGQVNHKTGTWFPLRAGMVLNAPPGWDFLVNA